ncbi:netrin receptor DCC-like, partial [Stylophora pistillata]
MDTKGKPKPACTNCRNTFEELEGFIPKTENQGDDGNPTFLGACAEFYPVDKLLSCNSNQVENLLGQNLKQCLDLYEQIDAISKQCEDAVNSKDIKIIREVYTQIRPKVFTGNSGKTDTRKNSLKEFASAKFIHFLPTSYHNFKVLRVEAYGILLSKVPSRPPTAFNLTASSSTSITASWQLPPVFARHGTIIGFKLFYKKKGSDKPARNLTIRGELTLSKNVTGLDEYTEYEFQVLAYSSDGDGPNSSVEVERTMEDVPSQAPSNFTVTASTSSIVTTYWQLPPVDSRNGLIIGFKLFYKNKTVLGSATMLPIIDGATHHKMVTGLDKHTEYEFQVLAYTSVGDGPKSSPVMVRTMKDGGCVEFYLGMENRTIPDNKVAASSEQSANTPSKNGRLHYTSGSSWCARASERNPYLQIDLRALHIICAVSTQGNSKADQWVKTYKLQLSTDGTTWTDYKELGQVKVLEGNKDRNSAVKHVLYGVLTRYVRFLPQTHQGGVCLRTEVFGVKQKP